MELGTTHSGVQEPGHFCMSVHGRVCACICVSTQTYDFVNGDACVGVCTVCAYTYHHVYRRVDLSRISKCQLNTTLYCPRRVSKRLPRTSGSSKERNCSAPSGSGQERICYFILPPSCHSKVFRCLLNISLSSFSSFDQNFGDKVCKTGKRPEVRKMSAGC